MEVLGEAGDGDQGGGVHGQTGVLKADEGDEQADAHRHAPLQGEGDGVEDGLAHVGQGQDDEDQALDKHGQQGHLPAVAITGHHGVSHIGVQAHARRQGEGQVGHQTHAQGAQEGGQGGGQQHGGAVHAGGAQNGRVDGQDIGHGHKGRDTGHDLGFDVCLMGRQLEYAL